jgi:hypothetical protein
MLIATRASAGARKRRSTRQEHLSSIRSGFSRAADDERARLSFLTPLMADGAAVVFTSPADSTYWPAARACKILHPPQPYDGGKHQEDDKKKRNPLQFCCPLGSRAVLDSSRPKLLFRASVTWLTHPLPVPP